MHHNKKDTPYSGESLMAQLLEKYGAYWPMLLLMILIFLLLAFIYLNYSSPLYEATATLMVKDEKKGSEDMRMMEAFSAVGSKKLIENEMEVIQSDPVINKVVRQLNLTADLYQTNGWRRQLLYHNAPIGILIHNHDLVVTSPPLPLEYRPSKHFFILNKKWWIQPEDTIKLPHATIMLRIHDEQEVKKDTLDYLVRFKSTNDAGQEILKNLRVSFSNKQSSIINLTYRDESPERAKDILHQIIKSYEDLVLEEKRKMAQSTIQLIDSRLQSISKNIDSIEVAVENYKAINNATDLEAQGQSYLMGINSNNEELTKVELQLSVANQIARTLEQPDNPNTSLMMSTLGVNDANLSKLMTDLNNKQLEYEKLKKTVPENNPILLSLKDQINRLKPDIRNNVNTMQKNLRVSRDHLLGNSNRYRSELQHLPFKERRILELSRDKGVNHDMYAFLLQKKEESELSLASTLTPFQVINDATTNFRRVSPNSLLTYLTAIFLSLMMGISIIFSREHLNPRILFRDELENITSVPVIGEISKIKNASIKGIDFGTRSKEAEEFRKLMLAWRNRQTQEYVKKIMVTSSIPGEGKSYVAWNMAKCAAASGKKVLLIDADVYQSGLVQYMPEMKSSLGLSDIISQKTKPDQTIFHAETIKGLDIIPAGISKIEDIETLLGESFEQLLKSMENKYDLVIIDAPPALLLTDAHRISGYCDSVLYIVRHNYTPKRLLRRLDQSLEINPLHHPFIVFNGVTKRGYASYGYGYGHEYTNARYVSKYG